MKKLSIDEIVINELSANELIHVIGACECACIDPFIPLNEVHVVKIGSVDSTSTCRGACNANNMDIYNCVSFSGMGSHSCWFNFKPPLLRAKF